MASNDLQVEIRNRVGILTLNRPEKRNALTLEMDAAIVANLKEFARSTEVGAVVLTGAGKGFCAGGDVGAMKARHESGEENLEEQIDRLRERHEVPWLLNTIPKVTIAAVNGAAAGAGLGIALSCDLRIASDQARFTTAFANIGYTGDFGTTWQLTRLVGPAKAKELFFLPDVINAEEAYHAGLVNRLVPHDRLMEETMAVAERIASGPLLSYRYMKANINAALTSDFRSMLDREAETQRRAGMSEDHREGVAAFLEKRPPVYKGR
ncbi:MAG: enoyl-CoA hydratase-related protein [SAR324 cluster bacterium]|nr:enoyl-CoA hydratase-related protein [SAR324 cluster bacterium]MCZ6533290.1 enoyl-CoA hydratase-related protein [SAR324 cluster bacterium]MCZ6559238.1 enoyl-CoA hydratase-related protein [SAR324 cluster bacterium]MCZ6626817.1 enoyl-CoA hydratase-related protein [SAR324 cluster bacterium]MCZ6645833.1 enoyl-CoA hydratase-related protein [SAR324 cluster bacterium]